MTRLLSSLRHDTGNPSTPEHFSLPLKRKRITHVNHLIMSKCTMIDLTELGVIPDTGLHQWVSARCFAGFPGGLWEAVRFQVPTFCFSLFLFIPLLFLLFFYCQLCCSIVNNILQRELSLINWAETRAKKVPREILENNGCGGSKDGKWDSWVWGPSSAHMSV